MQRLLQGEELATTHREIINHPPEDTALSNHPVRKDRAREHIAATLARGSARMASLLPKDVDRPQPQRRP
eukprot:scaffold23655_cov65-Phaeocystis_antarctica.AAC.6